MDIGVSMKSRNSRRQPKFIVTSKGKCASQNKCRNLKSDDYAKKNHTFVPNPTPLLDNSVKRGINSANTELSTYCTHCKYTDNIRRHSVIIL